MEVAGVDRSNRQRCVTDKEERTEMEREREKVRERGRAGGMITT